MYLLFFVVIEFEWIVKRSVYLDRVEIERGRSYEGVGYFLWLLIWVKFGCSIKLVFLIVIVDVIWEFKVICRMNLFISVVYILYDWDMIIN